MTSPTPRKSSIALRRGKYEAPVSRLAGFLREAAQHHAVRALGCPADPDEFEILDAAISVGTAVELLAKALIASVHPALLVKGGSAHGVMVVTLAQPIGSKQPFDFQTLDASVAVDLARDLNLGLQRTHVTTALAVRNGAAHFGIVVEQDFRRAVTEMTSYVDSALPAIGISSNDFWGTQGSAAAAALKRQRARDLELVDEAVAAARDRFQASALGQLQDASLLASMIAQLVEASDVGGEYGTEDVECPACENLVPIGIEEDWDVVREPDGMAAYPLGRVVSDFECPVCGLVVAFPDLGHVGIEPAALLGYDVDFDHHNG